jgi:16S rRNA (guanine(966)-N(2))-methyltransferase RsmD
VNQLRIIAGEYGGRLIKTPRTRITHPMGDRERGAIFNFLQHHINKDTNFLDAFAGSGAVGLEALSRGAKTVTFLEKDKKALKVIAENIEKLDVSKQTKVARNLTGISGKFDIILADPPYYDPQYVLILKLLKHLKSDGIFVLSHNQINPPPTFENLTIISDKTYAGATIKIYRNL